jgi:hypothetical protein
MKQKCRACQWWNATKEDDLCDSCRPLVKKFTEEIKEKYDTKRKSKSVS